MSSSSSSSSASSSSSSSSTNSSPWKYEYPGYEDLSGYKPGGLHPIATGDYLHNGRYRIMSRLGHGTFSTVWLGVDFTSTKHRYVAIKILTAEASEKVCETSSQLLQAEEKTRFVVEVLDAFMHAGPNGVHRCIVTELLGPTIRAVLEHWEHKDRELHAKIFGVDLAKRLIMGALNGIAELHARGIVHGDLHMGNMALTLPPHVQTMSIDELRAALSGPYSRGAKPSRDAPHLVNPHSLPANLIQSVSLPDMWKLCTTNHTPSIRLFDFTESFRADTGPPPEKLPGTAQNVAAPELLMAYQIPDWKAHVSRGIDIWAWACFAFHLLEPKVGYPFWARGNTGWQEHLADIIFVRGESTVGEGMWADYVKARLWVQPHGRRDKEGRITENNYWTLDAEGRWVRRGSYGNEIWRKRSGWLEEKLGREEGEKVREMLERALVVDPGARVGVEEVRAMLKGIWGPGEGV